MGFSAGRLRQRVDLVRVTSVKDGHGGVATQVLPIARALAAEVIGLNGREAMAEKVLLGISIFQVTIRYRGDVDQRCQLRYGSLDLNIRSAIDPDGRRERLVLVADTESSRRSS